MAFACSGGVPRRTTISRVLAATVILCAALASVGLTAPLDAPFAITVRAVWVRLALDVDVKLGPRHFHARWSALPDQSQFWPWTP